jgi:hypothetical protein
VSDKRLRDLERRWKETGSEEDAQAYLEERYRYGLGTPELTALARASAAMWTGKTLADTTTGDAIAALTGELKGHPKCTITTAGAKGDEGAKGEPGDQLLLDVNGHALSARTLRVKTDAGIDAWAHEPSPGVVELELSVKAESVAFARDRYGRPIKIGDRVVHDEYGLEGEITAFHYLDQQYTETEVEVSYSRYKESQITLLGYELPQPPAPPPRYPSEADRQLRAAVELNRMAEDRPKDIPASVLAVAIAKQGQLDVSGFGMDGAGRVISVGNMVRHRGEVFNVDQVNLPGTGEGPYPTMRQVRIKRDHQGAHESKTVPELEIDYIDERDA